MRSTIKQLLLLNRYVQDVVKMAHTQPSNTDVWPTVYSLVFSETISDQVYSLLRSMNQQLDYADPDTSYKEDVCAFAQALEEKCTVLKDVAAPVGMAP